MLTLYHFWSSTCSRKVRICLAEKGLEWQSRHVDIVAKLENLEPWYVKLNPNGVVPTLDHDGAVVIESNIILEYLDDTFPDVPLKPAAPRGRAAMRLWMDKAETAVHRNVNQISYNKRHVPRMDKLFSKEEQREILERSPSRAKRATMLRRLEHGVSPQDEALAEALLADVMDEMEARLRNGPWLASDTFSLADIAIAPFIERFQANGLERLVDFDTRPAVGEWWARVQGRESYKTAYAFENPNA